MALLGTGSKRFTAMYIVCLIALPVLVVTATVMYQNSSFDLFAGFVKARKVIWDDNAQRLSARIVGGVQRNISATYKENHAGSIHGEAPSPSPTSASSLPRNDTVHDGSSASTKLKTLPTEAVKNGSSEPSTKASSMANDKLLHGLLSDEFEESSCRSRYRAYLLQKSSPHIPSRYLKVKLRRYEHLHRRCGPHSVSYKKTMKELLKLSYNAPSKRMCRYLVWNPSNGLGNRMISLVAALLYSVLTDRVLLAEFRGDMEGLFCEPFPNSSWVSPNDFPYKHRYNRLPTYESLLKRNISSETSTDVPPFLRLRLGSTGLGHEYFHCEHSQLLLSRVSVLVLDSDQYSVPALFMVSSFSPQLNKMFPRRDTVFHHLARYLFHPSNEVWGLIVRFYEAYLAKANKIIGVQVRVFAADITPAETIMDQILTCTTKYKILPEVQLEQTTHTLPVNLTSTAILVASLHKYYSENLSSTYWWRPTVNGELIGVYQPSYEGKQKHYDINHNKKALADMYLLSLSDVLVTTGQSTFGYVAQGLGGLKPVILMKTIGPKAASPPCGHALSMEPCYHFPPKYDCRSKRKVDHISSIFPDMVPCEDLKWGVKLVAH
ncbi:hypothetical protein Droror1_Dr00008838 [Drosera rotundifolia]